MAQLKLTVDCFYKICRTCLSTDSKVKSLIKNDDLVRMLTLWTPITYDILDLLPKKICFVCISKLNMMHNFIQTCMRAETDLKEAIENDKQTLLPHLKALPEANDFEDESDTEEDADSDDSDSIAFSLPEDDLFECEEHKLKIEELEPKNEDDCSRIQIANVESIPEEAMQDECCGSTEIANLENNAHSSSFMGFNREEIILTQNNLEKYTESIQQSILTPRRFFDSVKFKCYLCENKLKYSYDKSNVIDLEFSTLDDDAHILCKKRIRVLRKIIKELYLKQDELSSLNNSWQKIFLQGAQKKNDVRASPISANPVNEKPTKPHEIGYRNDGHVYLGHLTWIPETDFDRAFRFSLSPNKFLINMALTLFGVETLSKSTITGISKHGVKKEPLNSVRVCALKSSLKYYMNEYNVPDYYQKYIWKNFNKILGQKISQISSEYKKRCLENGAGDNNTKKAKN